MFSTQKYFSNAKINLGLRILNKRKDGYHNLHSLLVELDFSDELTFTPSTNYRLSAEHSNNFNLPLDESNLISQAYNLVHADANYIPCEYSVHLKKNIPVGSGLGRGSSNAASTIKNRNQ